MSLSTFLNHPRVDYSRCQECVFYDVLIACRRVLVSPEIEDDTTSWPRNGYEHVNNKIFMRKLANVLEVEVEGSVRESLARAWLRNPDASMEDVERIHMLRKSNIS